MLRRCGKVSKLDEKYLPDDISKLSEAKNIFWNKCFQDILVLQEQDELNCSCNVACNDIRYEKTISSSKWPSYVDLPLYQQIFEDLLGLSNSTMTEEYVYMNFLKINVFFEEMAYQRVVEVPEWTVTKLISDIGIQMGVLVGASVFSLVELHVLCGCLLSNLFCSKSHKKEITENESTNGVYQNRQAKL